MARNIRHASAVKPISIPCKAEVAPANWDRVQTFNVAINQPVEDLYEIGRLDKMVTAKETLEASLSMTQFEYGAIDSYLQLAGLDAEPAEGLSLTDFDASSVDFYLPGKDEYDGTLEQTLWLQKMVLDSLGISMNAEERIERSYELSGNFAKILRYANKCLVFKTATAGSGVDGTFDIVLSDPAPVVSPNQANTYILQLWRVRDGNAVELSSSDFTYTSVTNTLQITSAESGDHFRVTYTAGSYGTAGDPTELNDDDDFYVKADNVTVTVDDGTNNPLELTLLTSLTINASLNRIEEGVIGSQEKVLREVESYEVTCSLGGYVKNSTIEEALMAQAGQSWSVVDFTLFSEVDVTVKIYKEATKETFLVGYKMTGLTFTDESQDYSANAFAESPINLQGSNLLITTDDGNL